MELLALDLRVEAEYLRVVVHDPQVGRLVEREERGQHFRAHIYCDAILHDPADVHVAVAVVHAEEARTQQWCDRYALERRGHPRVAFDT